MATVTMPVRAFGRPWRRLRRRSVNAAADLGATIEVVFREQSGLRTVRRLVEAAVRQGMRPVDALLFGLDHRTDQDSGKFLSKRMLTRLEDTLNPPTHHHLVRNKLDYHAACAERGVAAPRVLAVLSFEPDEGRQGKLGAVRIAGEDDLSSFLASLPDGTRLVFKTFEGSYGHGMLMLTVAAGGAVGAGGEPLTPSAILRRCEAHRLAKGYLVQRWLEPDPAMRPLMPGRALGAVRVVTLLAGKGALTPYAFVKIPVGKNTSDAFDHGRTGNLIAAVNVTDGIVGRAWGPSRTARHRLDVYDAHPETGIAIEGFRIPHWPEIVRVVSAGARAFRELRTLGWDVAVTTEGILLLEANHHWDPHGPQITLQRGISPDMQALAARARLS
jgi:hypothetical protein